MIHFSLIVCAFAEGFLLWFLVALIRESLHLGPHTGKANRTRRRPVSRSGELIPMNPGTTQDENAGKAIGKRTALAVLGALLFALPLHGQQTASDASGTADQEGTRSDQLIPPAVMKELEAQLQKRDGQQWPVSGVEGSEAVSRGPNVPVVGMASVSLAQPSLAQSQSGTEAALTAANNPETKPAEPFAFADWTWLNGNARTKEAAFDIHPRWPKSPACFPVDAGSPQG
jgi:hypothetical protein